MDINGVEFIECTQEPKSPVYSWALDSSKAVRTLICRGSTDKVKRSQIARAILGTQARVTAAKSGGGSRYYIERTLPHSIVPIEPDGAAADLSWMFAASIPYAESLSSKTYPDVGVDSLPVPVDGVRLKVEYRALPYHVLPDSSVLATTGPLASGGGLPALPDEGDALRLGWADYSRYVTRIIEPGGRAITFPNGFVRFVLLAGETNVQPLPIGLPVPMFRATILYTWHLVPQNAVPMNAIAKCSNAVNDAAFDGFAAETLLLSSVRQKPLFSALGGRMMQVEYRMIYAPLQDFDGASYTTKGWNHFPAKYNNTLRARQLTLRNDGAAPTTNSERVFMQQDFATLFRPDQ
jgi:hypothetical protein